MLIDEYLLKFKMICSVENYNIVKFIDFLFDVYNKY